MVNPEIITAKIMHIQAGLERLEEKKKDSLQDFLKDRDLQDIILFNLQITIQSCIDLASHIIADNNWEVPGTFAGLFDLLIEKQVLTAKTGSTMRLMAGFRNLVVHEYADLDMEKVHHILQRGLEDFRVFLEEVSQYAQL